MTGHFFFENLTWPEVAALDRDTPLVLPLGERYPRGKVESALSSPEKIGWLPAVPYGWHGSGLEVPAEILSTCLKNLLNCLVEDGFKRVFLLAGPEMQIPFEGAALSIEREKGPAEIKLANKEKEKEKVVLIPIGHTEQHALHLPLNVDTVCIEAVMKGTATSAPLQTICLPVFPYGVSTHRSSFAGTFNMGGRAFEDFFLAIIAELNKKGFKKIYLNSGHGGNVSFLVNVAKYAGERHPDGFCATTWLYLNSPEGASSLEAHRQSAIGGMGHACELETSLMLYLRPELVHMERAVDETDFITSPSYYMDWNEGGALVANPPWTDDTRTGAYGAPTLASAEKGKIWLQAAIREKAAQVDEIIFQQSQRELKRLRQPGK